MKALRRELYERTLIQQHKIYSHLSTRLPLEALILRQRLSMILAYVHTNRSCIERR